jgi:dienelactone hydrolase
MGDSEVATRAPESDAMQDTIIPGDSQAQISASMGDHCATDRPTAGETPTGEMTKFGDIDVYVSKPATYPQSPARLLLLLTGGTGVHSVNNQLQADKYAAEGYVVIVPDQFGGDIAPSNNASVDAKIDPEPALLERIKLGVAETAKSFMLDMWLARQTPEKVLPIIHKVLDTMKEEYADAVAYGSGIYGAGYCFGAKYILMLTGEHPNSAMYGQKDGKDEEEGMVSKGPLIKAGVIAHATLVTREDVCAVKAPIFMVCVGK